jgi:hypothetical protein
MAWINPITFEVLPFPVFWRPASMREWDEAIDWCERSIGTLGQHYNHTGGEIQISNCWWFLRESDAVLFKMRWL